MRLSNLEKETIILYNEREDTACVYTHSPALQKRLSELCAARPEQVYTIEENGHGGLTFELPKRWVRIVPTRILSPAQQAVLERMNAKKQGE
jgi:hypothetical protein